MHGIVATLEELFVNAQVKKDRHLQEALDIISDCSDLLCTLINDILDFQTLSTQEKIKLRHIPFNVVDCLEQVSNPREITNVISRH